MLTSLTSSYIIIATVDNIGTPCFDMCKRQGYCKYCGDPSGLCCQKNSPGNGCDGIVGGALYHTCVNVTTLLKGNPFDE